MNAAMSSVDASTLSSTTQSYLLPYLLNDFLTVLLTHTRNSTSKLQDSSISKTVLLCATCINLWYVFQLLKLAGRLDLPEVEDDASFHRANCTLIQHFAAQLYHLNLWQWSAYVFTSDGAASYEIPVKRINISICDF